MNPSSPLHPLQAALTTAAEQLMVAVQQKEDLGRELDRERTDRSRELAVLQAARQLKQTFLSYEERRDLMDGMKIPPKEKSQALEPYRLEVQTARQRLFETLSQLDEAEEDIPEPMRMNGG